MQHLDRKNRRAVSAHIDNLRLEIAQVERSTADAKRHYEERIGVNERLRFRAMRELEELEGILSGAIDPATTPPAQSMNPPPANAVAKSEAP